MSDALRGNFTPKKKVKVSEQEDDLTSQFEQEALRPLGGSICFVSKRKFLYVHNKKEEHPAEGQDKPGKPDSPSGS